MVGQFIMNGLVLEVAVGARGVNALVIGVSVLMGRTVSANKLVWPVVSFVRRMYNYRSILTNLSLLPLCRSRLPPHLALVEPFLTSSFPIQTDLISRMVSQQ